MSDIKASEARDAIEHARLQTFHAMLTERRKQKGYSAPTLKESAAAMQKQINKNLQKAKQQTQQTAVAKEAAAMKLTKREKGILKTYRRDNGDNSTGPATEREKRIIEIIRAATDDMQSDASEADYGDENTIDDAVVQEDENMYDQDDEEEDDEDEYDAYDSVNYFI